MRYNRRTEERAMYTKQALRELGVTGREMSEAQRRSLDENGFFIQEGVFTPAQCRVMADEFDRLSGREGGKGGRGGAVEPGADKCGYMAGELDRRAAREGDRGGQEVHVEPGAPRVSDIFNKTAVYDC